MKIMLGDIISDKQCSNCGRHNDDKAVICWSCLNPFDDD